LLTAFPLTEIERVVRRTALITVLVAALGAAAAVLAGQPYFVPGIALGVGLALANHRAFQSTALRFTTEEGALRRKPFAGSVFLRLGGCTVAAIGLLVVERPTGWGVIAGLALFQLVMLTNAIVALVRFQRRQAGAADA